MHYCIYLFTKELPTNEEIAEIMAPYSEYAENESPYPDIRWDGWVVGGRYGGRLKLKVDLNDEDNVYKWNFYVDKPRSGRLFRSEPIENLIRMCREFKSSRSYGFYGFEDIEYTMFKYCGFRDGYIYVDGCKISDLDNFEEVSDNGYGFIDAVFARQGTRWIRLIKENPEYKILLKEAFERNRDNYLTILDIHN